MNVQRKKVKIMKINERIRAMREDNDMLQKDIAGVLDMTQQQYSLYESGKRAIPAEAIAKLCKYYDVTADYILGLINEPRRIPRK